MTVSTARRMHWTEQEYLAMENESPIKHEYSGGEVFAMAGARPSHNRVATNTSGALVNLARRGNCGAFNSDQRIYIPATGLHTYADGGLVCGKWQIHTDGMCLLNPVVLVEVLSPSTREYDAGAKRGHYEQIPSLRHLLLIDQPERLVRHCLRQADGGWKSREFTGGEIELTDLGGSLVLDEIYPAGEL